MIKIKVAFLEGLLLSSQSEQSKMFSKSPDWLEKSRPSKEATFALIMQAKCVLGTVLWDFGLISNFGN